MNTCNKIMLPGITTVSRTRGGPYILNPRNSEAATGAAEPPTAAIIGRPLLMYLNPATMKNPAAVYHYSYI